MKNIYSPVHEKIERMREEFRAVRLASLTAKIMAGIALSTCEMLEREILSEKAAEAQKLLAA